MLLTRKIALLAKIETTQGTDSSPTGSANAMLVRNLKASPLTVEAQSRDLVRPYIGNSQDIVGAYWGGLQFEVEAAGSGAAGTAPKYGPLLRACGLAEVVTAGTKVTYSPVSSGFESVTIYYNQDGVLHKFTYGMGSVAMRFNLRAVPVFAFSMTGLFVPVTDTALPTADYTGFTLPLAMNKANTPTFTLQGVSPVLRNLTVDLANQVNYRNLVGNEMVTILDRKPVGNIEMEAVPIATKDWWTAAKNAATGAMQLIHGLTAGNIIELNGTAVQVTAPTYGDFDGAAMVQAGLKLQPSSGNDELSIVVR